MVRFTGQRRAFLPGLLCGGFFAPRADVGREANPRLKTVVRCERDAQVRGGKCVPLATGAQHREDDVDAGAIRDTRGCPPPKRCVFLCSAKSGSIKAHNSSPIVKRPPVVPMRLALGRVRNFGSGFFTHQTYHLNRFSDGLLVVAT